jgi:hypothetical protein
MKTKNENEINNWPVYITIIIIGILFFWFFTPKCNAQTIDMSFGQVVNSPLGERNIYRMKIQISEDIIYKWITVTPYGGWDTWSKWQGSNILNGAPFRDTYTIGIKTTLFDSWYVDFNHYCSHNVISADDKRSEVCTYENIHWIPSNQWDKSLTTITVGYKKTFSSWNLN